MSPFVNIFKHLIEGNGTGSFQLNGERDGSLYQQQNEHRGTDLSRKEKKDVPVGIYIHKVCLYLFSFSLLVLR